MTDDEVGITATATAPSGLSDLDVGLSPNSRSGGLNDSEVGLAPPSTTPASDKALSETPVSPANARLEALGVDTTPPEASYVPGEHPIAEAVANRAISFAQGAGVPTSLPELKEMGKFLIRNPIQDVKEIAGDISQIPSRISNFGQTIAGSPVATVYRDPLSPEAFGIYGTAAGMVAPALSKLRGGEVNAKPISETAPIHGDVLDTGRPQESAGQMPAAESGSGVQTRGQGEVVAGPPQEEAQPVGLTETLAELKRRNGVAPGEVVLPESPLASTAETAPASTVPESADVGAVPQTGIANKYLDEVYGDGSPDVIAGKGPKEWKALGQARLNDFQQTGNPINDPYATLTNLREGRVPVAKIPHDVSLLRAEHQRLVEDARQSEGSTQYPEKAQAAFNMATAIKQVAHGPASDVFRSLQEHDAPRYDNLTDFDQAIRERMGRESTPEEKQSFQKMATDVRSKGDAAWKEVDIAQRQVRRYLPKEKMSLEDAAKSVHDQLAELTKDCVL